MIKADEIGDSITIHKDEVACSLDTTEEHPVELPQLAEPELSVQESLLTESIKEQPSATSAMSGLFPIKAEQTLSISSKQVIRETEWVCGNGPTLGSALQFPA